MKIAVIGAGYWGKNLVRAFSELGALDTVCDINAGRLEEIKKDYKATRLSSSHEEVLSDDSITAVAISTPAVTHHQLAKEAILAGKDVFVEKPLSLTMEEGKELVALAEDRKRILMVGHLLEYHPGIIKLKELIDKGELGKINYIYSNRLNFGKVRREENILWSFAPHDISVTLLLLGEMPSSVSAHGGSYLNKNVVDVTVSCLEFKSGVKGHIFVSWLHPYKEHKLVVVGDRRMAMFDDVEKKDKLFLYNYNIRWANGVPIHTKEEASAVAFSDAEPLAEECKHFLRCVRTREKPKTDGDNGLKVLKVLQTCQRSLERKGEVVKLDSIGAGLKSYYVHPTATVEEPCEIGEGTKIWHYSHIMKGAKIGKNCQIGQGVFVGSGAEVGNGVKIQNNVSVYDRVRLEDDVFCGPSTVFTNVINPRSHVPRKDEFKATLVKKGVTLGANSTIICGTTIGEYAFIGAGAVVTKDVPAHALVYGNPARLNGWMCECGTKLLVKGRNGACGMCGKKVSLKTPRNEIRKI